MEKYELLKDDYIDLEDTRLYRIRAVEDFNDVKIGDLGGYIESEGNLSHVGTCWVYGNAMVCGNARVYGNAEVCDTAMVCGDAKVCGDARVFGDANVYGDANVCGNAWVFGDARLYDTARVYGNAEVCGDAKVDSDKSYIVFRNNWSSGRYFTYTKSNKMWKVGCFYGTGQELIEKAYRDSELSGKCYEAYVKLVEQLEEIQEDN